MPERLFDSFLGLEPEHTDPARARFAVLPVPYDATTCYGGGARRGPAAILEASRQVETWDEELDASPAEAFGIAVLPALAPVAASPQAMVAAVEAVAEEAVAAGKWLLTLGGEHTVAAGAARAVARHAGPLSILQIDAHMDLRAAYQGTPWSHACVGRHLAAVGALVQVGVRAFDAEEAAWGREHGVRSFRAREIAARPGWIEDVVAALGPRVYVSFDIDGLDPSVAPATGTPAPGGLGWWEALALLRAVADARALVGADVTEVAPMPGSTATEFAAAQLAYKIVAYASRQLTVGS